MSILVDVRKNFGEFELDVSFETGNDVVGLLGASGCGKSMTLKCIAGVVKPDEGTIVMDDVTLFDSKKKINLPPQRRGVGLLFQNYALFPNMTVEGNVMAVLSRKKKFSALDARRRFESLMEKFYLTGLENHYPANLSGGQQQRVAIARILASDPSIIMLDEPLSALDSYLRWQLEEELMQLFAEFNGTTLYVSHNRDEVYRLCERVCVMKAGRNEEIRPVDELFESPNTLASSLLSGCKNYSRAERCDGTLVRALDWGVELICSREIEVDEEYIGVRAHYLRPCDTDEVNSFECVVSRVIEDVFSTVINLVPPGGVPGNDFSRVRMELPKDEANGIVAGDRIRVCISPHDIMLLRK